MGVVAWNALPWWEQRLLMDGLIEEFYDQDGEGSRQQTNQGSVVFDGTPGELGALGYREQTL